MANPRTLRRNRDGCGIRLCLAKGRRRILSEMPADNRFHEIEIKLAVSDLIELKRALKRLRARKISTRTYERNTLYDTPRQDLRRQGQLIRIRTEWTAMGTRAARPRADGRAILTYKAPARARRAGGNSRAGAEAGRFKVKQEYEVVVTGADQLARILGGLGLRPAFQYEKYRTTYLLPGIRGVKIELDESPVGNYLELEGSPNAIDRAAKLLGYTPADYIRDTYAALYLADCRRRGHKPGHMLFPNEKKLR